MEGPIPVSALIHAATLVGEAELRRKRTGQHQRNRMQTNKGLGFLESERLKKSSRGLRSRTEEKGGKRLRGKKKVGRSGGQKRIFPEWGVLWRDCEGVERDGR